MLLKPIVMGIKMKEEINMQDKYIHKETGEEVVVYTISRIAPASNASVVIERRDGGNITCLDKYGYGYGGEQIIIKKPVERWAVLYDSGLFNMFLTKEAAIKCKGNRRIAIVPYIEGQGLGETE